MKAMKKKTAKKPAARKSAAPKKKVVKPIPDGYHAITPYLSIRGAAQAIEYYKKAFGARERLRMSAPDGKIGHAELVLGDSVIMLADEYPDMGFLGPQSRGGSSVNMYFYVKDVDAVVEKAVVAGGKLMRPVKDQFYGDRSGTVEDPYGHVWNISTHKEELSKAELRRRAEEAMKQMAG